MWRAAVVTVSDGVTSGTRVDQSGDLIVERLRQLPAEVAMRRVVADNADAITAVAREAFSVELAVFTGGTGLGPRDVTPQTLQPLLDYEVPGIVEHMRATGVAHTPYAMLSRQLAGVAGRCLVLALPGSVAAVRESLDAVWPVLPHALALLHGDTEHGAPLER
jgi:molybdenum cofactor synthesis domain-containing protein